MAGSACAGCSMNVFRNLKFAVRMFRRNPAVAISAILAIGLGVGAGRATYSFLFGKPGCVSIAFLTGGSE